MNVYNWGCTNEKSENILSEKYLIWKYFNGNVFSPKIIRYEKIMIIKNILSENTCILLEKII